jgi:hypothetical protein
MKINDTIDNWRVVMTSTTGETLVLEDVPDEACRLIDEAIRDTYEVTWA